MLTTIRQSSLGTWERCAEQFKRRYIDNEIIPPSIAAHIGTGVHKAAEISNLSKIKTGADEPLSVLQDVARDSYVNNINNTGVYIPPEDYSMRKQLAAKGLDETIELTKFYHTDVSPDIKPVMAEKWVEIKIPDIAPSISGTIDIIDENNNIIDIKTSSKQWPISRAETSFQATIYYALVEAITGKAPAGVEFQVMVKGKSFRLQKILTKRNLEDFNYLVLRIKIMVEMIKQGLFPPAASDSWICSPKYCGYWFTCPHIPSYKKRSN